MTSRADDCIAAVREALGAGASDDAVAQVFERVDLHRRRLAAEGKIDRLNERVRGLVREDADAARIDAAKARQHAMLNAIVRDRLESRVLGHVAAGLDYRRAMLAVLEGTVRGVEGGRHSVAATALAYHGRFAGDMLAAIQRDRPHLATHAAATDRGLNADTTREWHELREGGEPGRTGNDDARYLAKTFATFTELSRTDINRLGGNIRKLDGWTGPQVHDNFKIMAAGKERWVAAVLPRLDLDRTFPDADPANAVRILRDVYDTIVTGVRPQASARERGEFTGPSNLADRLGAERVLHFKTPDDWIAYSDAFGIGNLYQSVWSHQQAAARYAAQMQELGPNPEIMMGSLLESLRRRVRNDATLTDQRKDTLARALDIMPGNKLVQNSLGSAWAEATGLTLTPANTKGAAWGTGIRATQSLAKLGSAVISSLSDLVTAAANMKFHGESFMGSLARQVSGFVTVGRGKGEAREIAYLLNVAFDGIVEHGHARFVAEDSAPGWISKAQSEFFRWSGLTGWTERNRAVAARTLSAEMGSHVEKEFAALPERYRHVLSLHGIGERQWTALRAAEFRELDGRTYVTPERIRDLDDMTIGRLVEGRVTGTKIFAARRDLELALRRFFADETRFAIVETDAASRRFTTWGTQPGTAAGEAIRFVMQFKGFPIAFTQRVLGRAAFGAEGGGNAGAAHIGSLIAGLLVAGYASMTLKDMLRNWTPRNPFDPDHVLKTIPAALLQSGAAGIYGDFLFAQANSMGGNVLETLAGPAVGGLSRFVELFQQARGGEVRAGQVLNRVLQETPFINISYARFALDALVLNSLRERMSPGFAARQRQQRLRDYGQRPLF